MTTTVNDDDDKKHKQSQAGRKAWRTRYLKAGLSDWHATEAAGLLEKKCDQRDLCMDYLVENHPATSMHVLSLPGSRFEMERSLVRVRPDVQFTCLERSTKFIEVCRGVFDSCAPGGKFSADGPNVFANRRVQLLNINAGDLGDYKLNEPLTAIWFDGMGMLNSADFKAFIKSLRGKITREHHVPTVFTLLQGRDNQDFYKGVPGGISARRVRKLVSMLRSIGLSFEIDKFWSYASDSGGAVRMVNICGKLSRKTCAARKDWDLVSFDNYLAVREALTDHGLSAYLGYTIPSFNRWTPDRAPDRVVQVEIRRLVEVCQGSVLPVPALSRIVVTPKPRRAGLTTPWGKRKTDTPGVFVINEEEQAITDTILEMHEQGIGATMIAAKLRTVGIVSPRSGNPFARQRIAQIIKKYAKVACFTN